MCQIVSKVARCLKISCLIKSAASAASAPSLMTKCPGVHGRLLGARNRQAGAQNDWRHSQNQRQKKIQPHVMGIMLSFLNIKTAGFPWNVSFLSKLLFTDQATLAKVVLDRTI